MDTLRFNNIIAIANPVNKTTLNLQNVFDYVVGRYMSGSNFRNNGVSQTLGRVTCIKYKSNKICLDEEMQHNPTSFANQVSIDTSKKLHIKLFNTGRVHLTGISDPLPNNITRIAKNVYKNFLDTGDIEDIEISIASIVADFKLGFCIDRAKLFKKLKTEWSPLCTFEPSVYPGVKLQYYYNPDNKCGLCRCHPHCRYLFSSSKTKLRQCRKITIIVFRTGSVLIIGAQSQEQVESVANFIARWIEERKQDVS
jgi:TATA-box binding protein (TBP) (component of TFIID and TFIIIB)